MDDGPIVLTQAAVVQRRREVFGPAARTLIHPNDIESCAIGLRSDAPHIVRLTGTLKTMHEYYGLACGAVRLPVTEAEQLGVRLCGEEPRLGRNSGKEPSARPTTRKHCHDMWIAEQGRRCKILPIL
jgi:hypothetical protein